MAANARQKILADNQKLQPGCLGTIPFIFLIRTLGLFKSFVMNNKAFRNLFCNPQKSFRASLTRIIEAVNHSSNSTE